MTRMSGHQRTNGAVQVWVGARRPRRPRWRMLSLLLVGVGLGSGTVLLSLCLRWGLLLMLDPEALPHWQSWLQPSPAPATVSLDELRQALAERDQTLGEPIILNQSTTGRAATLLLVPTMSKADGHITAVTLFRQLPEPLQLKDKRGNRLLQLETIAIEPLPRELVLAPLESTSPNYRLGPQEFNPTQLTRLPPPSADLDLIWLTLEGNWSAPGLGLRYGQLLIVDVDQSTLLPLTVWSSPANRLPQWEDLDGAGHTDLVVDQTMGLEPKLQGFQVLEGGRLSGAVRLQPLGWLQVPIPAGDEAGNYQKALRLARNGLWREAGDHLTALKTTLAERWNPTAEAQLKLMARHAAITRQQASQEWAAPTQHILALLIDGQWEKALGGLEADPTLLKPLLRRLEVDQGPLWNRIIATTSLPEPEPAVYVWGGLLLNAQQNHQAAQDWLARQPISAKERQRLTAVLASPTTAAPSPLSPASSTTATSPTLVSTPPSSVAIAPVDALIGTVQPLAELDISRWYVPPGQATDASLGQWYTVEVQSVKQAQGWIARWQSPVTAANAAALWSALADQEQPTLTLLRWATPREAVATSLAVRGVAVRQGRVNLLATGPVLDGSTQPLLAFSKEALVWLDASQPQAIDLTKTLLPLARALFPEQATPSQATSNLLGTLQPHALDLTGNGQPEQIFTLDGATLNRLQDLGAKIDAAAPKTIILSQDNRPLYSDITSPQTLVALTNPSHGLPLALLVYRSGEYVLLPWSEPNQRFE
ncbi:MAG: hypothetical protein HC929_02535 [Leptolyngbyaceae cyanobacterium SM2_5_2]|nr:hypothetical protein [Leptolyngbyaceae cyanobacterium SM2_5_2]